VTHDPNREAWQAYATELGVNIQRERLRLGLSQERVAHAAGIAAFTYQKLERGESNPGTPANPRLRTLISIAEVLGVRVEHLLPPDPPQIATGR